MNIHDLLAPWRARTILAAMTAIVVAAPASLATAASVTFTSSNCSSYVLSGTPPNQTVTCVTGSGGGSGGVPVCTPTANPPSLSRGQTATISANCSNQPTGYTWSRGCTDAGATCSVIEGKPISVTYTVSASNGSGTGAAASVTISWH